MQVVAFQAMMELMADAFPGAFSGYSLDVVESHQRNKADNSGTAKAVVTSLQRMGLSEFQEVSCLRTGGGVCKGSWGGEVVHWQRWPTEYLFGLGPLQAREQQPLGNVQDRTRTSLTRLVAAATRAVGYCQGS